MIANPSSRSLDASESSVWSLSGSEFRAKGGTSWVSSVAFASFRPREYVCRSARGRFVIVDPTGEMSELPSWLTKTAESYERIAALSANWDSYGGAEPRIEIIEASLRILFFVAGAVPKMPVPQVFPLYDGGVQVEWHRRGQNLEIVFPVDGPATFTYEHQVTGAEQEGFASDVQTLSTFLEKMA